MSSNPWLRFTVEAASTDEDELAARLSEAAGGCGVEILDHRAAKLVPQAQELAPGRVLVRVYTHDPEFTCDLSAFPTARWLGATPISDDWQERWKDFFKATRVSERIVVRPPWDDFEGARQGDIEIVIEPGMAFGTGTHETTQLCLKALDGLIREDDRVLDVGCGSGVLTIAAGRLGAEHITAIDISPESVDATRENCVANGVARLVDVGATPVGAVEGAYDLVVANILSSILLVLRDDLIARMKPGGGLLLSGVPLEEVDYVAEAFSAAGVTLTSVSHLRSWACLYMTRPVVPG